MSKLVGGGPPAGLRRDLRSAAASRHILDYVYVNEDGSASRPQPPAAAHARGVLGGGSGRPSASRFAHVRLAAGLLPPVEAASLLSCGTG